MDKFETYGEMEDLRYQLTYWVNGGQVQSYGFISGLKALERFDALSHALDDLDGFPGMNIRNFAIRLDDYKLNKTIIKRSRNTDIESLEVMCAEFPPEEEEVHTYSLKDDLDKMIAGMDDYELQNEIKLAEISRFYAQEDGNKEILKDATERKRILENAYESRRFF